jgi:hypothetical protein
MAHMSGWVLKLEGHVQHVRITGTSDGLEVLSIIDFIKLVCKGTSDNYATRTWPGVEKKFELVGLVVYVPLPIKSPKSPYKQPPTPTSLGPATTRRGLQQLLLVLGDKVKDEFRQVDDSALHRFILGDSSRVMVFNFAY